MDPIWEFESRFFLWGLVIWGCISEMCIRDSVLQILVDPSGKVFMSLDKQSDLREVLEAMGPVSYTHLYHEELRLRRQLAGL